jgi:hypothetical protein
VAPSISFSIFSFFLSSSILSAFCFRSLCYFISFISSIALSAISLRGSFASDHWSYFILVLFSSLLCSMSLTLRPSCSTDMARCCIPRRLIFESASGVWLLYTASSCPGKSISRLNFRIRYS